MDVSSIPSLKSDLNIKTQFQSDPLRPSPIPFLDTLSSGTQDLSSISSSVEDENLISRSPPPVPSEADSTEGRLSISEDYADVKSESNSISSISPEPAYYWGNLIEGAPVFTPTYDEFRDFDKYIASIDSKWGHQYGVCKIIPPKEWIDSLPSITTSFGTSWGLGQSKLRIRPITQHFDNGGGHGSFRQLNVESRRAYSLYDFAKFSFLEEMRPPYCSVEEESTSTAGTHAPYKSSGSSVHPECCSQRKFTKASSRRKAKESNGIRLTRHSARLHHLKELGTGVHEKQDPVDLPPDSQNSHTPSKYTTSYFSTLASEAGAERDKLGVAPEKSKDEVSDPNSQSCATKPPFITPAAPHQENGPRATESNDSKQKCRRAFRYCFVNLDSTLNHGPFEDELFSCRFSSAYYKELEEEYWRSVSASIGGTTAAPPVYGADQLGTLWPGPTEPSTWNTQKLDAILGQCLPKRLPGVNVPYLYFGTWRATFAWHVEDADLFSINYLHFGAPKQWYSISPVDSQKLERLCASLYPLESRHCSEFIRHKNLHFSPKFLEERAGIKVQRLVQEKNEFVITFPRGYHAGYNLGFNCAESVNFALPRWFALGKVAKACTCVSDAVRVDARAVEEEYFKMKFPEGIKLRLPALDVKLNAGLHPNLKLGREGRDLDRKRKSKKCKEISEKKKKKICNAFANCVGEIPLSESQEVRVFLVLSIFDG
jgi:hypothetical protein